MNGFANNSPNIVGLTWPQHIKHILFSVVFLTLKYRSISRNNRWPAASDESKHTFNWWKVVINLSFFCISVCFPLSVCPFTLFKSVVLSPSPNDKQRSSASFSGQGGHWWIAAGQAGEAQLRFHQDKGKGKLFTLTRSLGSAEHLSTSGEERTSQPLEAGGAS